MFHQTKLGIQPISQGRVFLRFGTTKLPGMIGPDSHVALGVELFHDQGLDSIHSNVIMDRAEAIRLSEELRRLASLIH